MAAKGGGAAEETKASSSAGGAREFDVVVFGATGFTGACVVDSIDRH
jgi:hypothetical protein